MVSFFMRTNSPCSKAESHISYHFPAATSCGSSTSIVMRFLCPEVESLENKGLWELGVVSEIRDMLILRVARDA